jgi:glycosyltransferase involved in cell wall biosynthesis
MSQSPPRPTEPVSVVIPVHDAANALGPAVRQWHDALAKLGVDTEILIVDDGSTDGTAAAADELAGKLSNVRVLKHESRKGFGACLRTALPETRHQLFFYTALDYPYTPADLEKLLVRIAQKDEFLNRPLDAVSGCRTGRPVPAGWRALGAIVRGFARIALGLPMDPLPGWLGFREHFRSWVAWVVYADPLTDPNSAFKLFRKSLFDKFPIQSDGEFVHVELIAKATFVTSLIDELPLTPKPDPNPPTWWGEFWKVFRDARFTPPKAEDSPQRHEGHKEGEVGIA